MTSTETRIVADVSVPDTPLVDRAIEYARKTCEPYLFNHVMRSWLFAAKIAEIQNVAHDAEVLAVGALLHDITLNDRFAGPRRFEVEAADLARSFATGGRARRTACPTDLGQRCSQFDAFDRALQGGRDSTLHDRNLF
ncbi:MULTISPECIES: hypothetical protein [unclassified Rhizobium]|uniref:hypothetical protein n=1 Tax=unclassified Rhizobium TaxID=2613769 RepID=UPI002B258071|nr:MULTISPECIES: hypothetical protein [unclassified Rhizobium]